MFATTKKKKKLLVLGKDGVLTYQRTHGKKPWADMYQAEAESRLHGQAKLSSNQFHVQRAMQLLSSKFAKIVREKLRAKHLLSNRRNVSDVIKPSPVREWSRALGTQAFCDLCGKPSVNRCVFCITCGVVAHRLCVVKSPVYNILTKSDSPSTMFFECSHCRESTRDEQQFYDDSVAKIKRVNAHVATQQVIDEHIIARRVMAHSKKVKESVILIQSTVRKHRARTVFYMWRRTQLRVVVLHINSVFPLISPSDDPTYDHGAALPPGFIVVTVIDPIKHLQIMRVEKKLQLALTEGTFGYCMLLICSMFAVLIFCIQTDIVVRSVPSAGNIGADAGGGHLLHSRAQSGLLVHEADQHHDRPGRARAKRYPQFPPATDIHQRHLQESDGTC